MTLNLAGDIDAMMADALGVDVVIGGVTGRGLLDISNTAQQADGGMSYDARVTTLQVRTGVFTLSIGQTVVADGTSYRNDGSDLQDDGKTTLLTLSRLA